MKKLLLIITIFAFVFNTNAQDESSTSQDGFRVGINFGIPTGDIDIFTSFAVNLDVDYDWEVSENINVGLVTGISYFFGKDNIDDFKYLPIAASADVGLSDDFSVGGDIGYAVSLETGGSGDLLYRFQVRYQASEKVDVQARYSAISGGIFTISSISVGVGLRF